MGHPSFEAMHFDGVARGQQGALIQSLRRVNS